MKCDANGHFHESGFNHDYIVVWLLHDINRMGGWGGALAEELRPFMLRSTYEMEVQVC